MSFSDLQPEGRLMDEISKLKNYAGRLEARLEHSQAKLDLALDASGIGIWSIINNKVQWDEQTCRIFGKAKPPTTLEEYFECLPNCQREHMLAVLKTAFESGQFPREVEHKIIAEDGTTRWVMSRGRTVKDGEKVIGLVGTIMEITERKTREVELILARKKLEQANEALSRASVTDFLTGLGNRHFLHRVIDGWIAEIQREFARPGVSGTRKVFYMLLLDLDHFKLINDQFGHLSGDAVLADTARIIQKVLRQSDLAIRWGGEEFLMLVKSTEQEGILPLVRRLCNSLAQFDFRGQSDQPMPCTCSIGFVRYPFFASEPRNLSWHQHFELCDLALYTVKRQGRNGYLGLMENGKKPGSYFYERMVTTPSELLDSGIVRAETSLSDFQRFWSQPRGLEVKGIFPQ